MTCLATDNLAEGAQEHAELGEAGLANLEFEDGG